MSQINDQAGRKPGKSPITAAFEENYTLIKRFLSRFFSEQQDIEDVAQEAFLRAYVAEQYKDIEQPKAYLFRIAKNLSLTKLTKKSKQIAHMINLANEYEDSPAFEFSADAEVEALENLGLYCEAVASLPIKCRQIYLLRKVHGLSHHEIAERMSLSVSSVEKYLLKGMLECKHYLEKNDQQFGKADGGVCQDDSSIRNRGRQ